MLTKHDIILCDMFYDTCSQTPEQTAFESNCSQLDEILCELLPENLVSESGGSKDFTVELQGDDKTPRQVSLSIQGGHSGKMRTVSIAKLFGDDLEQAAFIETSNIKIVEQAQGSMTPLIHITVVINDKPLIENSEQTLEYNSKKIEILLRFLRQVKKELKPALKAHPLGAVTTVTRAALQKVRS